MPVRPAAIARQLGVSTTTLRHYEDFGMVPPVARSANGYRVYTDVHVAYFSCIREMMHGFTLSEIAVMLKLVMANKADEALWLANKAQAALRDDRHVCEQVKRRFLQKKKPVLSKELTIDAVSKATGVPPSTIRYWDNFGLVSASRCERNNYRAFTERHVDEILMIQAFKLAMRARGEKYAVEQIRREMVAFDFADTNKLYDIVSSIESHLSAKNRAQIRSISALYTLCVEIRKIRN